MSVTSVKSLFADMEFATGICKGCGKQLEFERFKLYPDLGPSFCNPCGSSYDTKIQKDAIAKVIDDLFERSNIPIEYTKWDSEIAASTGSDVLVKWLADHRDESAFVSGLHGKGKTHTVACCAYKVITQTMKPVMFMNIGQWLSEMMQAKMLHVDNRKDIKTACSVDLMVIDDIGKEKLTESKLELFYNVIDMRERQNKRTWFTSNFELNDIASRLDDNYGPAIVERMRRMVGDNICKL